MQKRGLKSLDFVALVIFFSLVILSFSALIYEREYFIKRAPTTPPTFHEFYGLVTCENNQQILNGFNIIGRIGSVDYASPINNGNYHLFVENGLDGQTIDFYVENENVEDYNYQSFGFTQKNFVVSNIYCSIQPGISINSPLNNQQLTQNSVDLTFTNLNFNISGIGQPHLHFYVDSDAVPYMFYNGDSNFIHYNNVIASNAIRLGGNSFRINGLNDGGHTIRLILANADHSELQNSEALDSVSFNINTQVPPGGGGGGSGGGGGGGGSRRVECNDYRDNDNDTKIDYPNDPGCSGRTDNSERDSVQVTYECSDNIDNDRDELIDLEDPGCVNSYDSSEENVENLNNQTFNNESRLPIEPKKYEFDKTKNVITLTVISLIIVIIIILIIYLKMNKIVFFRKKY